MSPLHKRKLGLLLSARPDTRNFRHGLNLADAALAAGINVYLYCIDDAVLGLADPQLQELKHRGLNLYACAYGAQKRNIPASELAVFSGLTMVSDIIAAADRFVSFN
jgi:sulfur relay (sulfurtransferase) complex TusBCD TusD component (DsrE family)